MCHRPALAFPDLTRLATAGLDVSSLPLTCLDLHRFGSNLAWMSGTYRNLPQLAQTLRNLHGLYGTCLGPARTCAGSSSTCWMFQYWAELPNPISPPDLPRLVHCCLEHVGCSKTGRSCRNLSDQPRLASDHPERAFQDLSRLASYISEHTTDLPGHSQIWPNLPQNVCPNLPLTFRRCHRPA